MDGCGWPFTSRSAWADEGKQFNRLKSNPLVNFGIYFNLMSVRVYLCFVRCMDHVPDAPFILLSIQQIEFLADFSSLL